MRIDRPGKDKILELFKGYEKLSPRDRAFQTISITNFFHSHYMEKIEIILAIAGEMQKHFKEDKGVT